MDVALPASAEGEARPSLAWVLGSVLALAWEGQVLAGSDGLEGMAHSVEDLEDMQDSEDSEDWEG